MQTTIAYWRRELEILEKLLASAKHRSYHEWHGDICYDVTDGVIARRRMQAEHVRRLLAEQSCLH